LFKEKKEMGHKQVNRRLTHRTPRQQPAPKESERATSSTSQQDWLKLPADTTAQRLRQLSLLQLQRERGNGYTQRLLHQSPPNTVHREDGRAPADTDEELLQDITSYLSQRPAVSNALEISDRTAGQLQNIILRASGISDEALKSRVTALARNHRQVLAAAAVQRLRDQLGLQREAVLQALLSDFNQRIQARLAELADGAAQAEQEEAERLAGMTAQERRRVKLRPQFPLILKYICRHILFSQIDKPIEQTRKLGEAYVTALGLEKDDPIFPEIYAETFVAELKKLTTGMRARLKAAVADQTLTIVSGYIDQRMGATPDTIRDEYGRLGSRVKNNIEGGIEGYFACRMGLLNAFGSPQNVPATLSKINEYYNSLVQADFLQNVAGQKPAGGVTLVHPQLKAALDRAEQMIIEMNWQDQVMANIRKYWSASIRENRNNPARLSDHSFGLALDINPDDNPNLAQFGQANWNFISAMVGEDVFSNAQGQRTAGSNVIREGGSPAEVMAAVNQIRAQSDRLVNIFDSEENLRARLREILQAQGITLPAEEIETVLDTARQAATGPQRARRQQSQQLQQSLTTALWQQHPLASQTAVPTQLTTELAKLLAARLKTPAQVDQAEAAITSQIQSPAASAPRGVSNLGIQALFGRSIVRKLEAVPETERTDLATQLLLQLRQTAALKEVENRAKETAGFITRSFSILQSARDRQGNKVSGGSGMHNLAARGFANLSSELVTALSSGQGGNLRWLGVHNQDMHHFELKSSPPLPRAAAPAAEATAE
jgi:hypothetical protein